MANVSHRLGRLSSLRAALDSLGSHPDCLEAVQRMDQHLESNQAARDGEWLTLGAQLEIDRVAEKFVTKSAFDLGDWANRLSKPPGRPPFGVPERA